jgi:hypothetical protein
MSRRPGSSAAHPWLRLIVTHPNARGSTGRMIVPAGFQRCYRAEVSYAAWRRPVAPAHPLALGRPRQPSRPLSRSHHQATNALARSHRRNRSRAVIQHAAAGPRGGHSPSVSAAILVEPGRGFGIAAGRGVLEAKLGQPVRCTALIERLSAASLPTNRLPAEPQYRHKALI